MFDLKGRTALVTGAARGIGLEIARTLASCGATVVATDVDSAQIAEQAAALRAAGLDVRGSAHDVTSPEAWAAIVDGIEAADGRLDVLVNNAGIMISKPFLELSLEEFRRTQTVNVESVFIGIRAAAALMTRTARGRPAGGSIVNLSSVFGRLGADMNAAYCASKGAVTTLTKAVAVELGRSGANLRVNSVHPGGVDTALGRHGLQALIDKGVLPDLASAAAMMKMVTPLGRMGEVGDVAGVVAFLASDASAFMTGSEVTVDGGFSIL